MLQINPQLPQQVIYLWEFQVLRRTMPHFKVSTHCLGSRPFLGWQHRVKASSRVKAYSPSPSPSCPTPAPKEWAPHLRAPHQEVTPGPRDFCCHATKFFVALGHSPLPHNSSPAPGPCSRNQLPLSRNVPSHLRLLGSSAFLMLHGSRTFTSLSVLLQACSSWWCPSQNMLPCQGRSH